MESSRRKDTRWRVMIYKGGSPPWMICTALRAAMICQAYGLDKNSLQNEFLLEARAEREVAHALRLVSKLPDLRAEQSNRLALRRQVQIKQLPQPRTKKATPKGGSFVAGVAGFEPAGAGVKVLCLTAWRYPNFKQKHYSTKICACQLKKQKRVRKSFFAGKRKGIYGKDTQPLDSENEKNYNVYVNYSLDFGALRYSIR